MNKIKFFYDLINAAKDKDSIKGSFSVKGIKDNFELFHVNNNFKKVNSKDKNFKKNFENKQFTHMFSEHRHNMTDVFHLHGYDYKYNQNVKLNKMMAVFGILKDMKIDQNEDKSYIMSLDSDKVSENMKKFILKTMDETLNVNEHYIKLHDFLRKFEDTGELKFHIKVFVSSKYEIQKVINNMQNLKSNEKINVNVDLE